MSRRPASVTQADVARVIRAAKQAGAHAVQVEIGGKAVITVNIKPSTGADSDLEPKGEIVL